MGALLQQLGLTLPAHLAVRGPAAAVKHGPSPEAVRFTKHFKELMGKVATLEAAKSPDAARIRKAAVDAAKLATHGKGVADATAQLARLDEQVAQAQAAVEKAAVAAAAPKERRYTVKIGHAQLTDATLAQAARTAKIELDRLEAELKNGFETHCLNLKIAMQEPFAAWVTSGVSRITGGQKMPALEIWDGARTVVIEARRALKRDDIDAIVPLFAMISSSTRLGFAAIGKANADAIESAAKTVRGLKKVQEFSTEVLVKGAEHLAGEAGGAAMAGGYATVLSAAEQLAAVHLSKTQKKVDLNAAKEAGLAAFIMKMVGNLLHGALAPRFSKMFGAYLSKADFSDQALLRMGRAVGLDGAMPRDYLATTVQKYTSAFITTKAEDLVKSLVERVLKGKQHDEVEAPEPEGVLKKIQAALTGAAQGKVLDLFVDFVVKHAVK